MNQPLHHPGTSERDWIEDFRHENGNYVCQCRDCGNAFFGHKRRIMCKSCALSIAVHGDVPVTE